MLPVRPSWHKTRALTTSGQHPLNQTVLPYTSSLSPPRITYREGNASSERQARQASCTHWKCITKTVLTK